MLETSARLLRLLSLLQSRRFWSGAELAEELAVTERSVRRDVDRLRTLGYPVQGTAGVAGGYSLGVGARLPPLLLEEDEAAAVAFALRVAAAGAVSGMEEAALRALAKLEQLLPGRIRKRVATLYDAVVSLPSSAPRVDAELLTALAAASRDRLQLEFGYGDAKQRASTRRVEPHGVVHVGTRWYFVAYDLDREDFRTFRIDRVTSKPHTGKRFVPRAIPGGDLATYVSRSLRGETRQQKVRVVFHRSLADVRPLVPQNAGPLTEIAPDRCQLESATSSPAWFALHLAATGVDFEVLEGDEVMDAVCELSRRLQRTQRAVKRARERQGR